VRDFDSEKRYIADEPTNSAATCIWFDDHFAHGTEVNEENSFSIRVDGVFNDKFRSYISDVGIFVRQSDCGVTPGGLSAVLRAQGRLPLFSKTAAFSYKVFNPCLLISLLSLLINTSYFLPDYRLLCSLLVLHAQICSRNRCYPGRSVSNMILQGATNSGRGVALYSI
jgi:hypothetical protein